MPVSAKDYLKQLAERAKDSHVHHEFQLIGLEIAEALRDKAHKSLYIKLAKKHPRPQELLALAKDVASRDNVKRLGAYFMAVATGKVKDRNQSEIFRFTPKKKAVKKPATKKKK